MDSPYYLAVIPARGGSKRVPRKNVLQLAGKPLIAYTIEAALLSDGIGRTVVSTDDPEIASVARDCGGDVPFVRPAGISGDDASSMAVLSHALGWVEEAEGRRVDAAVLLQPTSPFRNSTHIDEALRLYQKSGADALTSVCYAREHPYYAFKYEAGSITPFFSMKEVSSGRQSLPPAVFENGAIYIISRALLLGPGDDSRIYRGSIVPYLMDEGSSVDIDTRMDVRWAEFLMAEGGKS